MLARPADEVLVLVAFVAQAEVGELRGDGRRRGQAIAVGHAQGCAVRREARIHIGVVPRGVAELEGRTRRAGHLREERVEGGDVFLERGRQLEQQGAEFRAQLAGQTAEGVQFRPALAQLLDVRDSPRRFEREEERVGRRRGPAGQHLRGRHPVEGVVDLDRPEPLGVVRQHAAARPPLGVEAAPPLRVVVPGRPDPVHVGNPPRPGYQTVPPRRTRRSRRVSR